MKKIETGGPAFPTHELRFPDGVLSQESEYGMTLRDYFAAKAMQALIASPHFDAEYVDDIPRAAYRMAEAMLEVSKQ